MVFAECKNLIRIFGYGIVKLIVILSLGCSYASAAPQKEELIQLRNAQWDAILSLQDQVKNTSRIVINDNSLSRKAQNDLLIKLDKVSATLSCMKKKAFSTQYTDVEQKDNAIMHVERLQIPGLINISKKYIYLHPLAYIISKSFFVGSTIHELSHLCGTEDLQYYTNDMIEPQSVLDELNVLPELIENNASMSLTELLLDTETDWVLNADHYRMWNEYGFCVPDYNCKELFSSASKKLNRSINIYVKAEKMLDYIVIQNQLHGVSKISSEYILKIKTMYNSYLQSAIGRYENRTNQKVDVQELKMQINLARKRF